MFFVIVLFYFVSFFYFPFSIPVWLSKVFKLKRAGGPLVHSILLLL